MIRTTLVLLFVVLVFSPIMATPPYVWKMTYSVLDAQKTAEFCKTVLGLEQIRIPDPTLAKGRAWVKFSESGLQLHFVEVGHRYGAQQLKSTYEMIDKMDLNMTVFTPFMDNHGAIMVQDLTPYLNKLTANHVAFLGPVKRADGVYQVYFKIPGLIYLELDALTPPKSYPFTTWDKVRFSPVSIQESKPISIRK